MGTRQERGARFPGCPYEAPSLSGRTRLGDDGGPVSKRDGPLGQRVRPHGLLPGCVPRELRRGTGALCTPCLLILPEVRLMSNPCNPLHAWGLHKGPFATRAPKGVCAGMPTPCTELRSTWPEGDAPLHWGLSLVEDYGEIPRSIAALASLPYGVKSAWSARRGRRARR
jgi:hypothetical protein